MGFLGRGVEARAILEGTWGAATGTEVLVALAPIGGVLCCRAMQPTSSLRTLWRLYTLGWRFPTVFILMLVGMFGMGALNAGFTWFMYPVLKALGPTMGGDAMAQLDVGQIADLRQDMVRLGWIALALTIPSGVIAGGTWWVSQWLAQLSMQSLRESFFGHYLRLEMDFHARASKGDMISRMSADAESTTMILTGIYGKLQQRPVEAVGMMVTLAWIDWRLFLGLFGVLLPVLAILLRLFKKTKKRADRARVVNADTLTAFEQAASGIRVIKSLGAEERETARYHGQTEALRRSEMRTVKSRAIADTVSYGLIFLLPAVIMAMGVWMLDSRSIEPEKLIVFAGAIGRMTTLTRTTQRAWTDILSRLPAVERFFQIVDQPRSIVDRPGATPAVQPRRGFDLEAVRFRYGPESQEVLRGIDLHIPVNQTVALVGESGAGKSTMMDLLPRFYDVTGGRILLDGVDLRDLQHDSLVQLFSIVQQDSFLFNDTIYNNIRFGRPDADSAMIENAARRAHVHEAILGLEGGLGYDTPVGDRGERLSGGQRQRVAIARALLRDAPVLLLDEPTSALDADSERHVQEALDALMFERTCVVVAHRLATIQNADLICVLDPTTGAIAERGTHDELLVAGGAYARLVRMQQLRG